MDKICRTCENWVATSCSKISRTAARYTALDNDGYGSCMGVQECKSGGKVKLVSNAELRTKPDFSCALWEEVEIINKPLHHYEWDDKRWSIEEEEISDE